MAVLPNAKWELFAQEIAKGKDGSEAIIAAGYKTNPRAASVSANRLLKDANVRARIDELLAKRDEIEREATEKAVEALAIDKGWVMSQLVENVQMAKTAGDLAPANKALELLGKELGMFIERREVRTGPLDELPRDERERAIDAIRRELDRRAGRIANSAGSGPH